MRQRALDAERAGDLTQASACFEAAAQAYPRDAALLNSVGSFHARNADSARALTYFDAALKILPDFGEAIVNRAIALTGLDRPTEALADLTACEAMLAGDARYWSTRGSLERSLGHLASAARSYDACLLRAPEHSRGARGRARLALERGEADAVVRLEGVLATNPGDAEAWLDLAQALDAAGRTGEAQAVAEALVERGPHWIDALEFLAQLRWGNGDHGAFCDHYPKALASSGNEPTVARSWVAMLASVDRHADAAELAGTLRAGKPEDASLALLEAAHAGVAGDDGRAERIYAALELATPERWLTEARHRLRRRELDRAEILAENVLAVEPESIAAWALRDIAWRLGDNPRHRWLHGQPGLVAYLPFAWNGYRDDIIDLLRRVHRTSVPPVGQSVRAGTQTRGGLFDRTEPALAQLCAALTDTLETYRAALPPHDEKHPLLRNREKRWRISGSWSVRLTGAGHHIAHIHTAGMVSSAAYLVVPPTSGEQDDQGALDLGVAPHDLRIALPPLLTVRPEPGRVALFPSTLFHGTRAFSHGERMSAAFDVTPA